MNDVTPFGELVLRYRKAKNMSQARLAQLTGHTDGYISQLETGSRGKRPNRDVVVAIAQALDQPLNDLLVAAGFPPVEGAAGGKAAFADVVNADMNLRSDQKKILIDIYASFVGKTV